MKTPRDLSHWRLPGVVALCAASYAFGRWQGLAEGEARRPPAAVLASVAASAPGGEVITPLNMHDPTSLVMAPTPPVEPAKETSLPHGKPIRQIR